MKKQRVIYKSAITGKFVSKKYALENPKTTYKTVIGEESLKTLRKQNRQDIKRKRFKSKK